MSGTDELRNAIEQVYYPRGYYQLAAAGCVGIAAVVAGWSLYEYGVNGEWLAGVGLLVVALLWVVIAHLTNMLRRAHHGN